MNYRGLLKGNTIELAERLPFPNGQPLRVSVEAWPVPTPAGCAFAMFAFWRARLYLTLRG